MVYTCLLSGAVFTQCFRDVRQNQGEIEVRARKYKLQWYICTWHVKQNKEADTMTTCMEEYSSRQRMQEATTIEAISNRKPKTLHTRNYYNQVCKVDEMI